jgi:hypothetical protein
MMAELEVAGLNISTDDRGRLHFWGEVFNLGETTQRWVRVTLRLVGADNRALDQATDIAGLEWTLPGSRNPFYIRFLTPPENWNRYEIAVEGTSHDYHDPNAPQPNPGILVEKVHYRSIDRADLRCSLIGLLTNRGLGAATHVKVSGTLYGPEGTVVGVLSPYIVPRGVMSPGDEIPFELKYYVLGGIVANYSIQAQGRVLATP